MSKKKIPCQNCNPCAILFEYGGWELFLMENKTLFLNRD